MLKLYYSYVKKEKAHDLLSYVTEKFHNNKINIDNCTFNENGKPYCSELFFNVSHTDGMVIIAVSDKEVGVDVERICGKDRSSVIQKCTTDVEKTRIKSEGDFLCLWTKKESFIKYVGGNVVRDINKITYEKVKPVYNGVEQPVNTLSGILDDYIYSVTTPYENFDLILVM